MMLGDSETRGSELVIHGRDHAGVVHKTRVIVPKCDLTKWVKAIRPAECQGLTRFTPRTDGSLGLRRGALWPGENTNEVIREAAHTAWFLAWAGLRGAPETERRAHEAAMPSGPGFDHERLYVSMDGAFAVKLNQPHGFGKSEGEAFVRDVAAKMCVFREVHPLLALYDSSYAQFIVKSQFADRLEKLIENLKTGFEANYGEKAPEMDLCSTYFNVALYTGGLAGKPQGGSPETGGLGR